MVDWRNIPNRIIRQAGHTSPDGELPEHVKDMLTVAHDDVGAYQLDDETIPIIVLDYDRYIEMSGWQKSVIESAGSTAIDTKLNILDDKMRHVFVEIEMRFGNGQQMTVTIYANKHMDFFRHMANSGILALSGGFQSNEIVMIQMPNIERIRKALDIIKHGLGDV